MAVDALTQKLMTERENLVRRFDDIKANAADDGGRDLIESERSTMANIVSRITAIDEQLDISTRDVSLKRETADALARFNPSAAPPEAGHQWRSAGHALWDYLHKDSDRDARSRLNDFERIASRASSAHDAPEQMVSFRAAQHMGTVAADTTATAGGFGGLIVTPVAGPIIDLGWKGRPLVNLIGAQPAPNPFSFSRPRIIDEHLDDGAQAQVKQKAELVSYKFDVDGETVKMAVLGGFLNVSQQVLSWLPSGLDIILRQMQRRAERAQEKYAVTELAKATKKITLAANGDAAAVIKALGDGAVAVFQATGAMPTWIAAGPVGWARLWGLTDLAGRPLFPSLNPANALGTMRLDAQNGSVSGLPLAVTPGIADGTFYMGNGDSVELYTAALPVLEAVEPSVLGRQIAVAGALGAYQPITTEATTGGNAAAAKREAVVQIAP